MRAKLIAWSANLALMLFSIAFTLILLNLGFVAGRKLSGHDPMYTFDPLLGWHVRPNLNGARAPYPVYTDAHGFRILPGEVRDTRAYDVMLAGDSYCFGSWLAVEQTLAGMLKLNHPGLRIANTAVPGWGTDQELLALGRWAPMLKPGGTIVLLTYINDFDDIRHHWNEVREKPWFAIDARGLVLRRPQSWINRLCWSAQVFFETAYLARLAFRLQPRIYGDDAYAARLYGALLERMAVIVRARRARFVVLYASGREAHTASGERWAAVVRAAAERVDAKFFSLDDDPDLLGRAMFIRGDIHWNATGNRAAYSYLARRLAPLLEPPVAGANAAQ